MADLILFPLQPTVSREPSLREELLSRGIEPTGDERRRLRREAARRRREAQVEPQHQPERPAR